MKPAVTLLEDRDGQINLDIPVSGSLDDPKFSVWPIVGQIIVNLITKTVTAPFALLSSLTGGGEEMSFIEFAYGSALVTGINMQKIQALVKVLAEKPGLKMDIEGRFDGEKDKDGLKTAELKRKVKAQKLNDEIRKGETTRPIEQIQVQAQEYEKYLAMAYNAEQFPKPMTVIGQPKNLSSEDMEKLMLANFEVTDDELRRLASRRAENVKELILKSGKV